jgi:type I restriction enzyme R subunit
LATASINNAIEYYQLFKEIQKKKQAENPDYVPLNIACVFSPPSQLIAKHGDQQSKKCRSRLQEDLTQEKKTTNKILKKRKKHLKNHYC